MSIVWKDGPGPHVGWWNCTAGTDRDCWRWWDGEQWSIACYPTDDPAACAAQKASPEMAKDLRWNDSWPDRARVPRVDPGEQKAAAPAAETPAAEPEVDVLAGF